MTLMNDDTVRLKYSTDVSALESSASSSVNVGIIESRLLTATRCVAPNTDTMSLKYYEIALNYKTDDRETELELSKV